MQKITFCKQLFVKKFTIAVRDYSIGAWQGWLMTYYMQTQSHCRLFCKTMNVLFQKKNHANWLKDRRLIPWTSLNCPWTKSHCSQATAECRASWSCGARWNGRENAPKAANELPRNSSPSGGAAVDIWCRPRLRNYCGTRQKIRHQVSSWRKLGFKLYIQKLFIVLVLVKINTVYSIWNLFENTRSVD